MGQVIDINKQNREAMKWILNFYDLRKAYIDQFSTFNTLGAAVNDGMPRGTDTSYPAENKAISLIELERKKQWIITIEQMEQVLSEKSRKYLELRREAAHQIQEKNKPGRPGWVDYVQPRYASWHEYRYGRAFVPTDQTMKVWMYKIIDITVRIAIKNSCL